MWQRRRATGSPDKPKRAKRRRTDAGAPTIARDDAVYSDRYFVSNTTLDGVIKNISDFNQLDNNTLVCSEHFLAGTYLRRSHLAVYELRKTVEYRAVLGDLYPQYDFQMSVPAFRASCFERRETNASSFRDYVPPIRIEGEAYEQYFDERRWWDAAAVSRVSVRGGFKCSSSVGRDEDVDRISPAVGSSGGSRYEIMPGSESEYLKLSRLSVHELEDALLKRSQRGLDVRSAEDVHRHHYRLLEPLILKEDEYDAHKAHRARLAEHKKLVRITIAYTLAFFILVIVTFFIIYFA